MDITKNQIGLAGEFAVLSQLILRGYDANMLLGNTKKVDILLLNPETKKQYKLEVKTSRTKLPKIGSKLFGKTLSWMGMNQTHEGIKDTDLFYCFVQVDEREKKFRFFIVSNKIVTTYLKEEHKFWIKAGTKNKPHKKNSMRTFRLGSKGEHYKGKFHTPLVEEHENKWELLK